MEPTLSFLASSAALIKQNFLHPAQIRKIHQMQCPSSIFHTKMRRRGQEQETDLDSLTMPTIKTPLPTLSQVLDQLPLYERHTLNCSDITKLQPNSNYSPCSLPSLQIKTEHLVPSSSYTDEKCIRSSVHPRQPRRPRLRPSQGE